MPGFDPATIGFADQRFYHSTKWALLQDIQGLTVLTFSYLQGGTIGVSELVSDEVGD